MTQSKKTKSFYFEGFPEEYGYTNTPDIAFDLFPHLLTGAEIKVLDYVFRRNSLKIPNYEISLNQMLKGIITQEGKRLDYGCGVKGKPTIIRALNKLEDIGLIERKKEPKGTKSINLYKIRYSTTGIQKPSLLQKYIVKNKIPSTQDFHFEGFTLPRFTPIPDEIYDVFPHILSHRAYLVVRYICRHTFGYKKEIDNISLDQMTKGIITKEGKRLDYGCGIKRRDTVVAGIREAEELGIITVKRNRNRRGNNQVSTYGLKFKKNKEITNGDLGNFKEVTNGDLGGNKWRLREVTNSDPQNTVIQNTEQQNTDTKHQVENLRKTKDQDSVVAFLQEQGFNETTAKKLAISRPLAYVQEKVEYLKFLTRTNPIAISKPLGWLRKAIEENYSAPDGFQTREEQEKEIKKQAEAEQQYQARMEKLKADRAQEEAEQANKKQTLIQHYQSEYGTTEADRTTWQELKETLSYTGNHKHHLHSLEGLKLEQDTGAVIIGVTNQIILERISHPSTKSGLQRDIGFHLKRDEVQLNFVLMKQHNGTKT